MYVCGKKVLCSSYIYNKYKVLKNVVHVVLWYRCGIFALSALRYFTVLPLFMRLSGHLLFPAMACVNSFFVPLRSVKRGTKQVKMVQLHYSGVKYTVVLSQQKMLSDCL